MKKILIEIREKKLHIIYSPNPTGDGVKAGNAALMNQTIYVSLYIESVVFKIYNKINIFH